MDKVEDEQDDTEFYFDEIIDKFSDHDEVLLEDSIDPNLENSSIGTPNLEELAESSESGWMTSNQCHPQTTLVRRKTLVTNSGWMT